MQKQTRKNFEVCRPKTSDHRRGMQWFSSLTRAVDPFLNHQSDDGIETSLKYSLQFYSVYAETGDNRYLGMCEDFLKYVIQVSK